MTFLSAASMALALAPNDYSLFGDAEYVSPGNASNRAVELSSDSTGSFSGIDYDLGTTSRTFADIQNLSTDYKFDEGTCAGGSPRFQVEVASSSGDTGNIMVYLGTPPNYDDCVTGAWANTGNLLGTTVDTSQLDSGTFYDPYATALTKYGDYEVTGIQLVVDGGWSVEQVVDVDNTNIDGVVYTYEVPTPTSKEECKNGGFANLGDNNGNTFTNQGRCVSFVERNERAR